MLPLVVRIAGLGLEHTRPVSVRRSHEMIIKGITQTQREERKAKLPFWLPMNFDSQLSQHPLQAKTQHHHHFIASSTTPRSFIFLI